MDSNTNNILQHYDPQQELPYLSAESTSYSGSCEICGHHEVYNSEAAVFDTDTESDREDYVTDTTYEQ